LRARLANGPVLSEELFEEAKANGISEKTLRRAKDALHVPIGKEQGKVGGKWFWQMPADEDAQKP
jgi:hypothetical protein